MTKRIADRACTVQLPNEFPPKLADKTKLVTGLYADFTCQSCLKNLDMFIKLFSTVINQR